MSKNKARSKALHQTFSEIIPEMDKALNKQLLEVLMKYTERDNERKRLTRTVLIFTESSDQLSRATDRVPGLPASPG
ncbi:hypothetical protein ACRW41_19250, partial [Escherichia coli]